MIFRNKGYDQTNSARYHPLYITDNLEGGFGQKTDAQQREQRVFAGVEFDSSGFPFPTAGIHTWSFSKSIESIFIWSYKNDFVLWTAGSLCEWKHKTVDKWADSETFEDYMKTLILECETNLERPANMTWTVPMDAPNTLYYQVLNLYPF